MALGQQERIVQKGASRAAGELRERDILLCFVSFFVCVKNGYPPPRSLRKILVLPPRKPRQKRVPSLAKGPPPPLREILNSPLPVWRMQNLMLGVLLTITTKSLKGKKCLLSVILCAIYFVCYLCVICIFFSTVGESCALSKLT